MGTAGSHRLVLVWGGRFTETDHYYRDATRAPNNAHDFDSNGNLVPGQSLWNGDGSSSQDGVQAAGSVSVGRAPIANAEDAKNFVDKVLSYENQQTEKGPVNSNYLTQVSLFANNWYQPWLYQQVPLHPPGDTTPRPISAGTFWPMFGTPDVCAWAENIESYAKSTLAADLKSQPLDAPVYTLYAEWEPDDQYIPFDQTAATPTCWYFCGDGNFNRIDPSANVNGTPFIRIQNAPPAIEILFWHSPTEDGASVQKDRVFSVFQSSFPGLATQTRYYADYTVAAFQGQNVLSLVPDSFSDAINLGSHLVSVTGHGNDGVVVGVFDPFNPANPSIQLTNAGMPFIMYAHSFLTANRSYSRAA